MKRRFVVLLFAGVVWACTACGSSGTSESETTIGTGEETGREAGVPDTAAEESTEEAGTEVSASDPLENVNIEYEESDLFDHVFLELASFVDKMTYEECIAYMEETGYTFDTTEPNPDEDVQGIIQTEEDGNGFHVYVSFFPTDRKRELINLISYSSDEYEASVNDFSLTGTLSYSIYNRSAETPNTPVSSLDDLVSFITTDVPALMSGAEGYTYDYSPSVTEGRYSIKFGDFVSSNTNTIDGKSVLIIKTKISSSFSNQATVNQNYHNVVDLILNQGCDQFDEIQYWAVADMSDGQESKVVSFTVNRNVIESIAKEQLAATQLGEYVDDLYILSSLRE